MGIFECLDGCSRVLVITLEGRLDSRGLGDFEGEMSNAN
jgi:hypothetical protein